MEPAFCNGVNLYAISMQNEPDYAHEWTWWTPQEILRFMRENAGSINARVIAPESFQYLKNIYFSGIEMIPAQSRGH